MELNIDYPEFNEIILQGNDISEIINEIHKYWIINDVTAERAFENWINLYL